MPEQMQKEGDKLLEKTRRIAIEKIQFTDESGTHYILKSEKIIIDAIKESPEGNVAVIRWYEDVDTQSPVGEQFRPVTRTGTIPVRLLRELTISSQHHFAQFEEELMSLFIKRRSIYEEDIRIAIQTANDSIYTIKKLHGATTERRTVVSSDGTRVEHQMKFSIPLNQGEKDEIFHIKELLDKLRRAASNDISMQFENIDRTLREMMVL